MRQCCKTHRREDIDVQNGFDVDLDTLRTHQALADERDALVASLVDFIWPDEPTLYCAFVNTEHCPDIDCARYGQSIRGTEGRIV